MKRQPTDWEKILVNNAMGKGLICKIEKVKKLKNSSEIILHIYSQLVFDKSDKNTK